MKLAEKTMTAKLFEDGAYQAVLLPDEFRFEGDEVAVRRSGRSIILEYLPAKRIPPTREEVQEMFRRIDAAGGEPLCIEDRNQPLPEREDLFPD